MTNLKTILIIGKTGSGKSTIANVISSTNKFAESSNLVSKTREIQSEKFETNNLNYQVIDTVGIEDTKLSKDEVLDKIAEAVYLARNGISQIFFTVRNRMDFQQAEIYNTLKTIIFDEKSIDYTTIIRTEFINFNNDDKAKEDIDLMINSEGKISEIAKECSERFIHVNNSTLDISCDKCMDNESCRRCFSKIKSSNKNRDNSRLKLLKRLNNFEESPDYIPKKLINLNSQIVEFIEKKIKFKKELEDLISRTKGKEKIKIDIIKSDIFVNKSSPTRKSFLIDPLFNNSREIIFPYKKRDSFNLEKVERTRNFVREYEDKKSRLERLIKENELKIREKVFLHIFNNCKPNSLGDQALIKKLDNEINRWVKLTHFTQEDYGFCAWLKEVKKNVISEVKNYDLQKIHQLREEYSSYLSEEQKLCENFINSQNEIIDKNKSENWYEDAFPFRSFNKKNTATWIENKFSKNQAREWLTFGFNYYGGYLNSWLRDEKNLTPDDWKNLSDEEKNVFVDDWKVDKGLEEFHCDYCERVSQLFFFSDRKTNSDCCSQECYKLFFSTLENIDLLKWRKFDDDMNLNIVKFLKKLNFIPEDLEEYLKLDEEEKDFYKYYKLGWKEVFTWYEFKKVFKSWNLSEINLSMISYWKENNILPQIKEELDQLLEKGVHAQYHLNWYYSINNVCVFGKNLGKKRWEITRLYLSKSKLFGSLDLSDFVNLEILYCWDNKINEIKISDCYNLIELYVSNNKLKSIDISNNKNLIEFGCNDNEITLLNLRENFKLKEIYSDDNKLKFLILPNSNEIEKISVRNNFLDFDFSKLSNSLIYLDIVNNNVSSINISFFNYLINLKELLIGSHDEDKISKDIFNRFYGSLESLRYLRNLKSIDISNTDIDSGVEYLPDSIEQITFSIFLKDFKLSKIENQLKKFIKKQGKKNKLSEVYPKKDVKNIILDSRGLVGILDFDEYKDLETLSFCYNEINKLILRKNNKLIELNCDHNNLTKLDASNSPNLKSIYCRSNEIEKFKLSSGDNQLEEILVNNNYLKSFNFSEFSKSITTLAIHNNNISNTDISVFSNLVNLITLGIGNSDEWVESGQWNKFYGSLESLKNLTRLENLAIPNTDINNGLEYLPKSLEKFIYFSIYNHNPKFLVRLIEKKLKKQVFLWENYDQDDWKIYWNRFINQNKFEDKLDSLLSDELYRNKNYNNEYKLIKFLEKKNQFEELINLMNDNLMYCKLLSQSKDFEREESILKNILKIQKKIINSEGLTISQSQFIKKLDYIKKELGNKFDNELDKLYKIQSELIKLQSELKNEYEVENIEVFNYF